MKLSRIVLLWLSLAAIYVAGLTGLRHVEASASVHLNQLFQLLLFIISLYIFLKEPNRKNRFIFLNFTLYFALSIVSLLYDFVGEAFLSGKYARFLFSQYGWIAYTLLLSISIVYLVIDLLFHNFRIYQKYLWTLCIVLVFFGYYFSPFFRNPFYLYSTEEVNQWKALDEYVEQHGAVSSTAELANKVTLQSWHDGKAVGDLYPAENMRRIEELMPYLEADNWKVLFWKPLHVSIIQMDMLMVGFILLFFGYQYKKDPPQGAYIDKIMFLILIIQSMDILHNWGFIKSVEWGSFYELFTVGQYITVLAEIIMVLFFALRLRFITSPQGEFYETELVTNPSGVSRWRDWVDNIVLSQFFNFKLFKGRLFQGSPGK